MSAPLPSYRLDTPSLAASEPDLVRLWRENLSLRGPAGHKFAWTCRDAPEPPVELLLRAGAEAVGCIGVMPRPFSYRSQAVHGAILGDLAVDASHRSLMPALTLVRGARKVALERGAFSYGFPNVAAAPVLKRCGYRTLGSLTRYARVLRHARYMRRRISVPVLAQVAAPLVDGARFAGMLAPAARALTHLKLEWLTSADARFDDLWQRARPHYDLVGERSSRFLRWRFLEHPEERCEIAALVDRSSADAVHAYAVVLREGEFARIRDLFGMPQDIGPLLDLLVPALLLRGVVSASIRFLGHRDFESILLARGFAAREATWPVVYDVAPGVTLSREELGDTNRWHLTDADEDI
ncbi:MAG: hypothetical protein JNL21_36365 [Myxococcales bacterium]|nr:hypothetical protein [Myxococcales bacterium]